MRLTQHSDFALRVLIFLASRPGARVATQQIADAYGISMSHLQKVVRTLGELGLVHLVRGVGGGVELARDPDDVRLGALLRDLEDPSLLVECFRPETDTCVITPACVLKGALRSAQDAFFDDLDRWTLSDLVGGRKGRRLLDLTGG